MDPITSLKAKMELKTTERDLIRLQIQKAKLDAQMSRLQLQARNVGDESLIPAGLLSGGKMQPSELKCTEHKRLLEWLAENCDMSSKQAFNVPEPEVTVGAHRALLGHMLQWRLSVQGGVKLSVPLEAEAELTEIFRKTKLGLLGSHELDEFTENWLLVTTDLVADSVATPAMFLIHKESQKAIVVSAWPNICAAPPPPPAAGFDPVAFFNRVPQECLPPSPLCLSPSEEEVGGVLANGGEVAFIGDAGEVNTLSCPADGGMLWTRDCGPLGKMSRPMTELGVRFSKCNDQYTLSGPFGSTAIAHPQHVPLQCWFVRGLVARALEHGVRVGRVAKPARRNTEDLEEIKVPVPSCQGLAAPSCVESQGLAPIPVARRHTRKMSWSPGDRADVSYNGSSLQGVARATQGEVAHVPCDVNESGVITAAPLESVRHTSWNDHLTEGSKQC